MGDSVATRLDRPYGQQPETRALAVAGLVRRGATDLIEVLGLAVADEPDLLVIDGRICCPACRKPYPDDGRRACRRTTCRLGPKTRNGEPT